MNLLSMHTLPERGIELMDLGVPVNSWADSFYRISSFVAGTGWILTSVLGTGSWTFLKSEEYIKLGQTNVVSVA